MVSRRNFIASTIALSSLPALPKAQSLQAGPQSPDNTRSQTPMTSIGIILVGASWCPYCHRAAQDLHLANQQWGWPVLITTLDKTPIPPFVDFMDASRHPLTADIRRLPTTLIVDPHADDIVGVIEGFRKSTYLSRIAAVMKTFQEAISNG